jgi:hypothetical protein
MPRLDYSGGASCPSLKLEPSRQNLATQSEYYGAWTTIGTATFTANYGASPEGVNNAYRFEATSGARGGKFQTISVSSGTTYTLSIYAKSLSGTQKIRIGADNGCSTPQGAQTFDVTTEWQRFSISIASTQTSWNLFIDNVESGTACTGTYLNADMLIYGFQCEAGSHSTSYIPCYGTSNTRLGESCSKTGISSLIGSTAGTIYAEIEKKEDGYWYISLSNGSTDNWVFIGLDNDVLRGYVRGGAVTTVDLYSSSVPIGRYKMALAYSANDVAFYVNGSLVGSDTSATMPTGLLSHELSEHLPQ